MSGTDHQATSHPKFQELSKRLAEVSDLEMAGAVLYWDQHTGMPQGGAKARGEQLTTLRRLAHARFTSPEIGELLADLADLEKSLPYDGDAASLIRVTRRKYDRATRLDDKWVVAMSEASTAAYETWLKAREAKDFAVFRPALERIVDLSRQRAAALAGEDGGHPMDPLVDMREPGLTVATLQALFDQLRTALVPLVQAIAPKHDPAWAEPLQGRFDQDQQLAMGRAAARAIGFDLDQRGRQAISVHPFAISFAPDDTRITTRIIEGQLGPSFFAMLHEAGHGTYMQGIPDRLRRGTLHNGASAGLHESQSRLWENIVGRSRPFWRFFLPIAKAFFPSQLGGATEQDIYRAANVVRPSYIRVEADEVTYNLHIMIRHELEKEVFEGELAVADLPAAWNAKFAAYLGLTPPDDLLGVLQDIHWAMGFGASFESYTIGNVAGVALYQTALREHPGMHDEWERGDFRSLLSWMQENVHAHGAKFTPEELLTRATGAGLDAGPYLTYIKTKYGELYGV